MKQDQRKTLIGTLLLCALMIGTTSAGLIEDLTSWVWNYFLFGTAIGGSMGCWTIGVWGLFWDDDNGVMIQTCMDMFGGSYVEFPVEYSAN